MNFKAMMFERPEGRTVAGGIVCWIACVFLGPNILNWVSIGFFNDINLMNQVRLWMLILCFLLTVAVFRTYLKDSLFSVRMTGRPLLKEILSGTLQLLVVIVLLTALQLLLPQWSIYNVLPLSLVSHWGQPGLLLEAEPLLGSLVLGLMAPVIVCCLYYATVFAPICSNRPGLAYLVTALVMALPYLHRVQWSFDLTTELICYLQHLPLHLCVCAIYQKTDTVWVPLCSVTIVNVLSSMAMVIAFHSGWLVVS